MTYAQIKIGGKLHLVCEPGESCRGLVVRAGRLSHPICGIQPRVSGYRMTCNMPLGNACKRCRRAWNSAEFQREFNREAP